MTGRSENIENVPDSPPGVQLPPPPPRAFELVLTRAFEKMGMKVAAIRAAILTQPLHGRVPCSYATPCTRGCSSRSNLQSTTVLIPPARATGNLTVACDAVQSTGRCRPAGKGDRRQLHRSHDRQSLLGQGKGGGAGGRTCSTVRILLNSKSSRFPHGVGNSSGLVGKYLMDTVEFLDVVADTGA